MGCDHPHVMEAETEIHKGEVTLEPWPVWQPDGASQPSFPVCQAQWVSGAGPLSQASLPLCKVRGWALCLTRATPSGCEDPLGGQRLWAVPSKQAGGGAPLARCWGRSCKRTGSMEAD